MHLFLAPTEFFVVTKARVLMFVSFANSFSNILNEREFTEP